MPSEEQIDESICRDNFERTFRARLQAAGESVNALHERHQHDVAKALLSAGVRLIPSEYLRDDEFVVSMGVYEAAKTTVSGESG